VLDTASWGDAGAVVSVAVTMVTGASWVITRLFPAPRRRKSLGRRAAARQRQHRVQPAGSVTVNVDPRPGPALDAWSEPPCASTSALLIARPIPEPPLARSRAVPTR